MEYSWRRKYNCKEEAQEEKNGKEGSMKEYFPRSLDFQSANLSVHSRILDSFSDVLSDSYTLLDDAKDRRIHLSE